MLRRVTTCIMLITCIYFFSSPAMAILKSTFDTGTEGWTAYGDFESFNWASSGGNPGGNIFLVETQSSAVGGYSYFISPNTWDGDWTQYKGGTLSYQLMILSGGDGNSDRPDVRIWSQTPAHPNLYMNWISYIRPHQGTWTDFSVQLTPSNFGTDQTHFDIIMSNVTEVWIRGEMVVNPDSAALDNVTVTPYGYQPPLPLPGSLLLLGTGLLGLGAVGWRRRRKI